MRAGDCGTIRLKRGLILPYQGFLGVHLLPGDGVLLQQLGVAAHVLVRIGQQRLVSRQLPFGLIQDDLKWTWVNLREHIPLLDQLPLDEEHFVQLSVHTAAHHHRLQRCDGARKAHPFFKVFLLHLRHGHCGCAATRTALSACSSCRCGCWSVHPEPCAASESQENDHKASDTTFS